MLFLHWVHTELSVKAQRQTEREGVISKSNIKDYNLVMFQHGFHHIIKSGFMSTYETTQILMGYMLPWTYKRPQNKVVGQKLNYCNSKREIPQTP